MESRERRITKEDARKVITSEFTSCQQEPVMYDVNASLTRINRDI